jgi:carboxypeptidase family protein
VSLELVDMRTRLLPVALLAMCSLIAPAFCLAQQPPAPSTPADPNDQFCKIAGSVVSAKTGEPLKKAQVVLSQKGADRDDPNKQPLTATTDAAGHFSIEKIPEGSYDVVVTRNDYIGMRYGQDQIDKPGAVLTLAPGQKMTDLLFRLQRMGIITGRITDEDGDPVREAQVNALLYTTTRGKMKTESHGSATTNDLGEYRIYDLEPGRYALRASGASRFIVIGGPSQESSGYQPTYYSGTTDSARASTLEVKAGDEISGIDFVLAPKTSLRTYKIHGHVSVSVTGYSGTGRVELIAFPRGNRSLSIEDRKEALADAKTGEFEIKGVPSGEYIVTAALLGSGKIRTASQKVNVGNSDLDGVSLVVTDGIDIPGRIELEGKSAATAANLAVWLDPAEEETQFIFGRSRADVQPNGSFVLKEVDDGSYSINVRSKCQECYLKSAGSNGVDLLERGVQVSSGAGPSPIAIVYSSNTGTLTGAVTNK